MDVRLNIADLVAQLLTRSKDNHGLLKDIWNRSHPDSIRVFLQEERRDKAGHKQLGAARRRRLKTSVAE